MKKLFVILLMIIISVFSSGCTDKLGLVDFSGELPLEVTNNGWGYRVIGQEDLLAYPISPNNHLLYYRDDLNIEKSVTIGKTEYLFVCRYTGGYSPFSDYIAYDTLSGFQIQVYNYNTHKRVETFTAAQNDSGHHWRLPLDDGRDHANHYMNRSGECKLIFFDSDTGCDYIVDGTYYIRSEAKRKTDKKKEYVLDKWGRYVYKSLKVTGQSRLSIGAKRCLYAKKYIAGIAMDFYVLDWNLDGSFSEDDVVYCSYHQSFYDFGKVIRLTNSYKEERDNKYMFKLHKPTEENGNYRLQLELIEKGVREE